MSAVYYRARPKQHAPLRRFPRAVRMFEAGKVNRLNSNWSTTPIPVDQLTDRFHRALVARSRYVCANDGYAKAYLRMCDQNIVGPNGVVLRPNVTSSRGALKEKVNTAVQKAWKVWGKKQNCDVLEKLSWLRMQSLVVRMVARDGEIFCLLVADDSSPFGFRLQLIDPQRIPVDHNVDRLESGGYIRHGIEFNAVGKPVRYWVQKENTNRALYQAYSSADLMSVSAEDMVHLFHQEDIGQTRGFPWTFGSLDDLKYLNEFEMASLKNAVITSKETGTIEWDEGYGPTDFDDSDLNIQLEDGSYWELPAGARLNHPDRKYVGNDFDPFQKSQLRRAASGLGVAYNNLSNNLEDVNFSSIRQGALDEREMWKTRQEWFIEDWCHEIFEAWVPHALRQGAIKVGRKPLELSSAEEIKDAYWQPRRWSWIDPNSETKSASTAVDKRFMSVSQVIRDQGRDPQQVFAEIAQENEEMKRLGITPVEVMKKTAVANDDESEEVNKDA